MNDEIPVAVDCLAHGFGWECRVFVGTPEKGVEHVVTVSRAELGRLAPGDWEPTRLVEQSFRYLLEREPAAAILRTFAIGDIAHYFPDYPTEIGARL